MKIDRDNPKHWLFLIISGVFILLSIPFRVFRNRNTKSIVFFYQMHGNSKVLADFVSEKDPDIKIYFLAFPEYLKMYEGKHEYPTLSMLSLRDMIKVAQCDVLVTNYGALTLVYLAKLTNIKFVDVWHGIPMLKNQTPKIMDYLNYYEEVWVSSPAMKKFYESRYKLKSKIVATGYARTDSLVNGSYKNVKDKYSLPNKKIIMIAPTWKQNDPDRSELPFGLNQEELINKLNTLAKATNSLVIFRAHLLSGVGLEKRVFKNIKSMPSSDFPDTEELLSITDILITDWSSLAFDFMVLDRPVLFIENNAPFQGEDLEIRSTPSNRFGDLVSDWKELELLVTKYLKNPNDYLKDNNKKILTTKNLAYGPLADGKVTERYYKRLTNLLKVKTYFGKSE